VIKSHVLYRLSYALAQGRCVGGCRVRVNSTQQARSEADPFEFPRDSESLPSASDVRANPDEAKFYGD
jgi:hypothetical protein